IFLTMYLFERAITSSSYDAVRLSAISLRFTTRMSLPYFTQTKKNYENEVSRKNTIISISKLVFYNI
ncbi:MAG TPA: hypothetical protein PKV22_07790, partial [Paludibacteraceae bacterium]|nr:hypothetical protein [Paludibacteraceae bacterium]